MSKRIGPKRQAALIQDILGAQHDLVALAEEHRLNPDDLAAWVSDVSNQRVLSGLCKLADLQTQILLSRYRLLAATRLIKLATEEDQAEGKPDVARRACVDLLRLDLKRAEVDPAAVADERLGALDQHQQEMFDEFERMTQRLAHDEDDGGYDDPMEGQDLCLDDLD